MIVGNFLVDHTLRICESSVKTLMVHVHWQSLNAKTSAISQRDITFPSFLFEINDPICVVQPKVTKASKEQSKKNKEGDIHRHLRIIDCLTARTACLVCFISTVNGHIVAYP
jgi:hypothetical protein